MVRNKKKVSRTLVIFSLVLNGQRFYQQGAGTPPEYRANGTSADTRAVGDHKCPGKGAGAGNKDKTPKFMMRAMLNDAIQPAPPVSSTFYCIFQ